jgi:D-cysteine desulfhydrase
MTSALFEVLPELAAKVPWTELGTWPSALDRVELRLPSGTHTTWVKREDTSAPGYAGNKIRTLEMVFGAARAAGKREIWATGAYGSNHALAAVVHAARAGFASGAVLWPQPWSSTAEENLFATVSLATETRFAPSVIAMPALAMAVGLGRSAWVMPPGAATPIGAMGHASAAVELALQLRAHGLDGGTIVLPVGSTCTTAGLLVGTRLAQRLGLIATLPAIHAVRVTPWPVTDWRRIVGLAARTAARFEALGVRLGPAATERRGYTARLTVIADELGPGYGHATPGAWRAIAEFLHHGLRLDTTYSGKAASYLLRARGRLAEPVVFWSTKSGLPLPPTDPEKLGSLPERIRGWARRHG